MNGHVRDTQKDDLDHLAENLREADVQELYAQSGLVPKVALKLALLFSRQCKTMCDPEGTPIGVFGVNDTQTAGLGSIWMMATPDLLKHQRQFLRECREGIYEVSQGYSCVFNCTDARNTVHHKWLKWCGFTFIKEHEKFGRGNEPFYEFVKIL